MSYNIIEKLPDDIQKKIYYDYLEIDILYQEIMNIIYSSSLNEEYNLFKVIKMLDYILSKEKLVNYLCNNDEDFKIAYKYHIINKKHKFKLLTPLESFAFHWIL
jgi:hypothetical protein